MTQAHQAYDIQQVPSLPVYWYDPATELVFSDGFTAPVLSHHMPLTTPWIGNVIGVDSKLIGDVSKKEGSKVEDVPEKGNAFDGLDDLLAFVYAPFSKRVHLDRSIFFNQFKIKQMATKLQFKNDAAFERTRENVAEFSRAGKAGKLIRQAFREVLINASERSITPRMVKVLYRVVAGDLVNDRGERTVQNGEVAQLENFNFNQRAALTETLYARYTTAFDRVTGLASITIPPFVSKAMVDAGSTATHFRIILAAAAIDFDKNTHEYAQTATVEIPWNNNRTEPINLSAALPANTTTHVFIVVGIELYQQVNAKMYALKSGEFSAAAIVKVVPKV